MFFPYGNISSARLNLVLLDVPRFTQFMWLESEVLWQDFCKLETWDADSMAQSTSEGLRTRGSAGLSARVQRLKRLNLFHNSVSQFWGESEFAFSQFYPDPSWLDGTHLHWGTDLAQSDSHMSIFSGNTEIPKKNALPVIEVSLNPVRLTPKTNHQKSTLIKLAPVNLFKISNFWIKTIR